MYILAMGKQQNCRVYGYSHSYLKNQNGLKNPDGRTSLKGLGRHYSEKVKTGLTVFFMIALVMFTSGCGQREAEPVSMTDFALGTTCSVKLYGSEYRDRLQPALEIAKQVEEKMSVNLEDSEISRVNKAAGESSVSVSGETFQLLEAALDFARIGNGAFDPTIGPLVELWDIGSGSEQVPTEEAIDGALSKVDFMNLELNPNNRGVFLKKKEMALDLGAIAKGWAADRMVDYLLDEKVAAGIVNLGGNVYAFGPKPAGGPWKIGIQSPYDDRGTYIGIVEISEGAVVTSGKYERFFIENGTKYHHILSTEDGFPVENGLASVSIVSSDATTADALSTLVFAMGLEEGLDLTEDLEGVEAIFITEEKKVFTTTGLRDSFKLTDQEFRREKSFKDRPEP